jgi:hypothetical protein
MGDSELIFSGLVSAPARPARLPLSRNDAQGNLWRAAMLDEPGDLMPVDTVRVDLGHDPGDTQTVEL